MDSPRPSTLLWQVPRFRPINTTAGWSLAYVDCPATLIVLAKTFYKLAKIKTFTTRNEKQKQEQAFWSERHLPIATGGTWIAYTLAIPYHPEVCSGEHYRKAEDLVSSSSISHDILRDKLSEFLAVERGGLKLYEQALRVVSDPDVSRKFQEFRDQTSKHESILLRVMNALGFDTSYVSPAAKLADQKATSLLNTMTGSDGVSPAGLSSAAAEMNAIENIVLAETKDHADWELLGKIARQSNEDHIRDILKPAVSEVEPEEDEHLKWTKEQLARLEFQGVARKR